MKKWLLVLLVIVSLAVSGCSGKSAPVSQTADTNASSGSTASSEPVASEPVNLILYISSGTVTAKEFRTYFADPVHKKFPNVTVEQYIPPEGTTPEDVFTLGTLIPDLIYSSSTTHNRLIRLGVYEDLRDYIKKYQFDESRIKPYLYNYVKNLSDNGEIFVIPYTSNQGILYYNKDIFDKFGVPYPPDEQMTWDEAIELGAKLTRTENGVNYIGIDGEGPVGIGKTLGLKLIDPVTNKSLLNTPDWIRVFNTAKKNYEIPGFIGKDDNYIYGRDAFLVDRNVAMRSNWLANMVGPLEELQEKGQPLNWDIAPSPGFSDHPGQTREAQAQTLSINKKSTHKDLVFEVIQYILSDEVQRIVSRNGRVPAIVNQELEKEFGADNIALQGKKIQNVFVGTPVPEHNFHKFESDVLKYMTEATKSIALNQADVNTAIRKASEAIDKEVERLEKGQ